MANIFLSYHRRSEKVAKALASDLQALSHSVWFDQELSGGQIWWDQILASVRECDVFVFVLDPESLKSEACKREYGYAANLGKPVLPVVMAEGVSINRLPPALSKIQFVDYGVQDRDTAFRLARALTSVPPPGPLPDPLPDPPEVPLSYLGSLTERVETTNALSHEDQSDLVLDLKRGLRDPETADDSRELLQTLRKRRDLFAPIAEEIDELLVGSEPPMVVPPTAETETPPRTTGGGDRKRKPIGLYSVIAVFIVLLVGVVYWQHVVEQRRLDAAERMKQEKSAKQAEEEWLRREEERRLEEDRMKQEKSAKQAEEERLRREEERQLAE